MEKMQFGFSKVDITPRPGVELYGFGPFLHRYATAVREPLYARAMAAADGENTVVIVVCDLVGVSACIADEARERTSSATGIPREHICVHCTHTHSAPRAKFGIGQGEADMPYLEILPVRIAQACTEAVAALAPGSLCHTVVPCEGIGYNREHDVRPSLEEALNENWRPAMPEITDTEAHVLRVDDEDSMIGFISYFSCHPVVGSAPNTYIHSDFCGVATNLLERETPGVHGIFLQGCEGNINSCVVHHGEQESLQALDVIASRYARQIRPGISSAQPLGGSKVAGLSRQYSLTHIPLSASQLETRLAEAEAVIKAPGATDDAPEVRRATVHAIALRKELRRQAEFGREYEGLVEIQALRIGSLVMVGAPYEIMLRYKRRVQAEFDTPVLVLSLCNDARGYAPEKESFDMEDNYAARTVPHLCGYPPLAPVIEDELVAGMVELAQGLLGSPPAGS